MRFNELDTYMTDLDDNSTQARLNDAGEKLLSDYNDFIEELKEWVTEDAVINMISVISAEDKGTQKFQLANRLDTITSGGKNPINLDSFPFHEDDPLKDYIEI